MWQTRNALPYLMTRLELTHRAVEIGVWKGDFAAHILEHCPLLTSLYLVDSWAHRDGYADPMNLPDAQFDKLYEGVLQRFATNERAHIMRGTSVEMADELWRGGYEFDCVYIDADHGEASCATDIEAWWPLVRSGGILAGHDYLDGERGGAVFGVKTAVDRFVAEESLTLHVTKESYPSWLVVKA